MALAVKAHVVSPHFRHNFHGFDPETAQNRPICSAKDPILSEMRLNFVKKDMDII